jgi:hypothetical protein
MKDYKKITSDLKQTIERGGAKATICALKRLLIVIEKKTQKH